MKILYINILSNCLLFSLILKFRLRKVLFVEVRFYHYHFYSVIKFSGFYVRIDFFDSRKSSFVKNLRSHFPLIYFISCLIPYRGDVVMEVRTYGRYISGN